jgi:hypothetical protein
MGVEMEKTMQAVETGMEVGVELWVQAVVGAAARGEGGEGEGHQSLPAVAVGC